MLLGCTHEHFALDPGVSFRKTVMKANRRRPAKLLFDQGIVAVSTVDALRRTEIVVTLELDAGEAFSQINELIDCHQFIRTKIQWLENITRGNHLGAFRTVVDIHERAGLLPITPYLDLVPA